MKKLLPIVALGALAGCTPAQVDGWLDWWHDSPEAAVDFAESDWVQRSLEWDCDNYCDVDDPEMQGGSSADAAPVSESDGDVVDEQYPDLGGSCSQWSDAALAAGFSASQWNEPISRIMSRESGCNPGAYNPSGASGLMQVMAGWADDCGGSPSDLFDPYFNLRCAHYVYEVQGWGAWSTY